MISIIRGITSVSSFRYLFILPLIFILFSAPARADLIWHWEDRFSSQEQQRITQWLNKVYSTIERHIAPYPFDIHVYMFRRPAGEPVPWAKTDRRYRQSLHFYVDTRYSQQEFLDDWTAPHEFAHLLIPYVGENMSWFAEGFASYLQYRVMHDMNMIDHRETQQRYRYHIEKAARNYKKRYGSSRLYRNLPFAEAAPFLRSRGDYPTMYWGGAVYFLQADNALRTHDSSLIRLLAEYQSCCRNRDRNIREVLSSLDKLALRHGYPEQNGPLFSGLMHDFQSKPGFPDYRKSLGRMQ